MGLRTAALAGFEIRAVLSWLWVGDLPKGLFNAVELGFDHALVVELDLVEVEPDVVHPRRTVAVGR